MDVEKSKKEANEMFEKACTVYQVSSRILEDEKNLNSKFLEFLDREGKRTGKQTRQYVEYLYKKFQKERRDSLSDWQLEMLQVRAEREQQDNMGDIPNIIDTGVGGYNLSL